MLRMEKVREVTYDEARKEIDSHIKKMGREVYISELVSELKLDIDMVLDVMKNRRI